MESGLPADLKNALERLSHGVSRNDAARRAAAMSATYRGGGGSQHIASAADALAYAFVRMPATCAAIAACLEAIGAARPDFAPATLLDIGAGPGTAAWAAAGAFPDLSGFTLIDSNAALRNLALDLTAKHTRLGALSYRLGDAQIELAGVPAADLVVASYVAAEMPETVRLSLLERMWAKTADILLIVEPGTPDGYRRILGLRDRAIALGAYVIAPCPHEAACPLVDPDWCHFSQRLQRTRDHKQVKDADAPFEDEKFSYVALCRTPPPARPSRVLTRPVLSKVAVTLKLCTPGGVVTQAVPRRDKSAYAAARRLRWGDTADFR